MRYNRPMPIFTWYTLLVMYSASAAIVFLSVIALWLHWRNAPADTPAPWWIQINMAWKLMADGEQTRTNGNLARIALWALIPFLGTGIAAAQCVFPFVYAVYAFWLRYLSAWWAKPVQ